MDDTITETDFDATSRQFAQNLGADDIEVEHDLAVDGLSESLLSRLVNLIASLRH